jgi:hypothetical protein
MVFERPPGAMILLTRLKLEMKYEVFAEYGDGAALGLAIAGRAG